MNFPSQIFFNDVNHVYRAAISKKKFFVAASVLYGCGYLLYDEKVRRTMRTAIVSYVLKYTVKGYPLYGLTEASYLVKCVFPISIIYFPLVWMFHRCIKNNKINRLHERCYESFIVIRNVFLLN